MSLLFTIYFQRIQPNLPAASKSQVVDRTSNVFRTSVTANEFHIGPDGGDGDGDDDKVDAVVINPKDATDVTTRDMPVSSVGIRANTGRSPLPDSVKPFQVDAFEALRMYGSGMALPNTGNNRKENKDTEQKKRTKTEKRTKKEKKKKDEEKARPQQNKKAVNNNRANTREGGLPQVAWIMSFGGSVSEMHQLDEWATWLFPVGNRT